jgi:xanthine/uracil permease
MLSKIESFLDGKKTYIVAILIGLSGAWQALGHTIPEYVWSGLAMLGLGAVRSAVGNQTSPKV